MEYVIAYMVGFFIYEFLCSLFKCDNAFTVFAGILWPFAVLFALAFKIGPAIRTFIKYIYRMH